MAFIKTIPANNASGKVLEMYERQEDHWGYVPNYAKVFCHRPELMARWGRMLSEIRRPMDDRRFELVTFVVAKELRHSSCSMVHGDKLASFIGRENVIALAQGKATTLTKADLAIVTFARDIAQNAGKITNGQVDALKETHGLSDDEIFDIAATAAGRCFFTKILDALGTEPDIGFLSINSELRSAVSAGRPISHLPAESTRTQPLEQAQV